MSVDFSPAIADPFVGIDVDDLVDLGPMTQGKVRDIVDLGDTLVLISTDRISAFDVVLGTVPYRGQILNELAAWWFRRIDDIVPSHVLSLPDANVTFARKCKTIPVEVVVRSRLSGSTSTALWTMYESGARKIYGRVFPDGMRKNEALAEPIITPTTKAGQGAHDEPVTEAGIVNRKLVSSNNWEEIRTVALEVFKRGQQLAADAGLVLVDTKYEFGFDQDNRLTIIDELHTPDSSRYWRASTMQERVDAGQEPENLDKEALRLVYVERGYRGEGDPEPLDPNLSVMTARLYEEAFETLTGRKLAPASYPAAPRVIDAVRSATA